MSKLGVSTCSHEDGYELRKGPWSLEEDNLLIEYINVHGEGHWNTLAERAGIISKFKQVKRVF